MRLLYAPGVSERVARIEALRACRNGVSKAFKGAEYEGAARQYAVRAGNRGGIVVCRLRKSPGGLPIRPSYDFWTAHGAPLSQPRGSTVGAKTANTRINDDLRPN